MEDWLQVLGQLTGEDIYHLTRKLDSCMSKLQSAGTVPYDAAEFDEPYKSMYGETEQIRTAVLMQVARITVPIIEAQNIIYRARFARGHPIRMNPEL